MRYKSGYKYQLVDNFVCNTMIKSATPMVDVGYLKLYPSGKLVIRKGYAWDGPSGPTFDTKSFMRGSLVHDALYQLIRQKYLHPRWRKMADEELIRLCKADGMSWARQQWVYAALRAFGGAAASPKNKKPILVAP
jgi:hypothetical protein